MKQQKHWLLAAIAAPAAHFSGCGWLSALAAGLAIYPLTRLPVNWEGVSKPHGLAQTVWVGLVCGLLLKNAAAYWPSDNEFAVPLTLLALALATDRASGPRIGAVLSFCLLVLAVPLICAAAATLEPAWLLPEMEIWPFSLALVLLLPSLPSGKGTGAGPTVMAVLLAAACQGVLSPKVAASLPDAFYQTGRTLGHMEPILAAAMTLSYYATAVYLHNAANTILPGKGTTVLYGAAALAGVFLPMQSGLAALIVTITMWVLVPLARGLWGPKNKSKKDEKGY